MKDWKLSRLELVSVASALQSPIGFYFLPPCTLVLVCDLCRVRTTLYAHPLNRQNNLFISAFNLSMCLSVLGEAGGRSSEYFIQAHFIAIATLFVTYQRYFDMRGLFSVISHAYLRFLSPHQLHKIRILKCLLSVHSGEVDNFSLHVFHRLRLCRVLLASQESNLTHLHAYKRLIPPLPSIN